MTRDGIEWPMKDLTLKRKLQLIWQVIRCCVRNTVKTNDWLAIYEILIDGCNRELATREEDKLSERFKEGE